MCFLDIITVEVHIFAVDLYLYISLSRASSISSLGRNIILTTMPAGTKLIAGNKPVSFVTAQQFQQLQQQGQATQVFVDAFHF